MRSTFCTAIISSAVRAVWRCSPRLSWRNNRPPVWRSGFRKSTIPSAASARSVRSIARMRSSVACRTMC
uniref:Putative secreted protein n=1 Tax=Anopheles triannulatus TaxID=58253 RepID=A0A2M4B1J8_9DIPT